MLRSFHLLFWAFTLLFFSCDKVVEKPVEDTFPKNDLKEIRIETDESGEVAFDVVTENQIRETVSVQFSKPVKGKIEPDPTHHRFIYRAYAEETGLDSFSYTISKPGIFKSGKIYLQVKTPLCSPKYSGNVDYNIGNQLLDTALFIPFDPRDSIFCKSKKIEITDDNPLFHISSVRSDGFFVKVNGLLARTGAFSINYKIVVHEFTPFPKLVKFSLDFTPTYCDKVFQVRNTPFPIRFPHGKNFIILDRRQFSGFVNSCQNDVLQANNWFIPVSTIHFNYELDSSRVRIQRGPGPQELKFGYRFENVRHKADTGFAVIRY